MFPASLLSTLLLAMAVAANPIVTVRDSPVTLPLTRKINLSGDQTLYQHDFARAQFLKSRGTNDSHSKRQSTSAQNQAVSYIASVGVGSPATTYDLIIDTGSSNTWVGAGTAYNPTGSSTDTGNSVSVSYGSGSFSGEEYIDTVTIGSGLVISKQSIGVASQASGFDGVDGILGIGPVDLTEDTVSGTNEVPTVTDNLLKQGTISTEVIGVSFQPETSDPQNNGELTWGATDSTKFTGSITYTSLTSTSPASLYWGINESIAYGSTTILSTTAGIVDTGTTLLLIATNAYDKYVSDTGSSLDNTTGLLKISSSGFSSLKSLDFVIGGTTFVFTANAQIWPRSLNTAIGGTSGDIYLIVGDLGSDSGEGLDFINGQVWLERFYAVFDTTNSRVGFATTSFTTATTN